MQSIRLYGNKYFLYSHSLFYLTVTMGDTASKHVRDVGKNWDYSGF